MKNIYQYIIENQSSLDYKKAIKTLVDKFGFREVRRGSETGVEKDGKYCKVQVEEFPYGGGYIVIDSRQLFTKMSLFDYIVFIDHRKEFQNVVYVAEMEDLMGFLQRARDEKFVLWPTKSSELGKDDINPTGMTVRINPIKNTSWFHTYKPTISDNPDKIRMTPQNFEISSQDFIF